MPETFLQRLAKQSYTQNAITNIRADIEARAQRMRKSQAAVTALMGEPDIKPLKDNPITRRLAQSGPQQGGAGNAPIQAGGGARGKIIRTAAKQLGKPYVWGGASPSASFDCSGLVQWAYRSVGIKLPRVSADQARYGRRVPTNQLRKGDLVAWDNSSRNVGADHIAIYIGGGKIIEAAKTGTNIRVRPLGQGEGAWGVQIMR